MFREFVVGCLVAGPADAKFRLPRDPELDTRGLAGQPIGVTGR